MVFLLSSSLGNCKQKEMNLIYFPLSALRKRAKLRAEYTNKMKDLTLGGEKSLFPGEKCDTPQLAHYQCSETRSQLLCILGFHHSNLNYRRALTLLMLLLLFPWCCPSERCSATTRAMQPGQDRGPHGSRRQRVTDTWQGYQQKSKTQGSQSKQNKI